MSDAGVQAVPELPDAIRQVRLDLGMSPTEFARALKCSVNDVAWMERDLDGPALMVLMAIGSLAKRSVARSAIIEALRERLRAFPIVKVVG